MKSLLSRASSVVIGGLCVAWAMPLSAAVVYDNLTGTILGHVEPGTSQVGDQVIVAGGSSFQLSKFTFQYWGASASGTSFAGDVQVQVSFYANDGAPFNGYATPGTLLGQSTWFSLFLPQEPLYPNHTALLVYDASEFINLQTLPGSFTWAVQFQGMVDGDKVGVDNFVHPLGSPGQSYPDYWYNNNGNWQLLQANGGATPVNFGASIEGVMMPEPSTYMAGALLLLPFAGTFLARRKAAQETV